MSRKGLSNLLDRYLAGKCSPEEEALIENWLDSFSISGSRLEDMPPHEQDALMDNLYQRILATNQQTSRFDRRKLVKLSVAASVLVLLGLSLYFYLPSKDSLVPLKIVKTIQPEQLQHVKLVVGNQEIILDSAAAGLTVSNKGKIVYNEGAELAAVVRNATLITPAGATYHLSLSDGTSVVLNAGSRITFPTHFSGTEARVVSLDGQAYFEVAKQKLGNNATQKLPFIVKTAYQDIEVLGTHFDVKAYAADQQSITTLVEGKVKSSYKGQEQILRPGEEVVTENGHLEKGHANIAEALAWMDSKYIFDDTSLKEIFTTIGRWYGKDIHYNGVNASRKFGGSITFKDGLEDVLEEVCSIADIHYKIEGRRVMIMN